MEAITFEEIRKVYPDGTYALRGVSFSVKQGEIHGLLGENGAGKTTLMRILYGEIKPTSGKIKVFGREVRFSGPWDAIKSGIGMVYQKFSLVEGFTVLENVALSALPLGMNLNEVKRRLIELMNNTGLEVPLDQEVSTLPVGLRQRVEILKALVREAKVLVLDEPTSVLTPIEVKELFRVLKELKQEGLTIIFITHKLKEVKAITDRVTVLRKGRVIGVRDTREVSELELARMMVGRDVLFTLERVEANPGGEVLRIEDLWIKKGGLWAVKGVNLVVRAGEILGIAGVQGNGQKELVEAIVGMRTAEKGRIIINGEDLTGIPTVTIYESGVSYIPDMRHEGLVMEMNLVENLVLTRLNEFTQGPFIRWDRAAKEAERIIEVFNVLTDSLKTPAGRLSGGNQQKFMLGREISKGPKLIIASEPTHGLDVGATEYVRRKLLDLKREGKAVLLVSTDLDEILQLSDRIAVMYEGEIIAQGPVKDFTLDRLGLLMGGIRG